MTPRQEILAVLVAGGMKPKDAYVQAGYTGRSPDKLSSEILNNPEVAARVEELKARIADRVVDKVAEESALNQALIRDSLVAVIKEGFKKVPVISGGEVIGEKCADLASVNSALKTSAQVLDMMPVNRQSIELSGETKKLLDSVVASIAAEVEDPAVLERIISRLSREGAGAPTG